MRSSRQRRRASCRRATLLRAWSPYILLVIFVLLWGYAPFKALLDKATIVFAWPGLDGQIQRLPPVVATPAPYAAKFTFNSAVCVRHGRAVRDVALRRSCCACRWEGCSRIIGAHGARSRALRSLTIASVLALAYVMNYSGNTATLGLAFAATGALFPFFSALLGWLGVFLTGSDTSANALFGNLQVVTANTLGLSPELMAASNSSGGVMGKMISLQSISVAAAATGMPRRRRSEAVPLHAEAQSSAGDGHRAAWWRRTRISSDLLGLGAGSVG